jgi:hypothetical protein
MARPGGKLLGLVAGAVCVCVGGRGRREWERSDRFESSVKIGTSWTKAFPFCLSFLFVFVVVRGRPRRRSRQRLTDDRQENKRGTRCLYIEGNH